MRSLFRESGIGSVGGLLRGVVLGLCAVSFGGCYQVFLDMWNQPRYETYEKSDFFENGSSARMLVDGVVEYKKPKLDTAFYTGKVDGEFVMDNPLLATRPLPDVLARGQERYAIFCTPCHGPRGDGDGMIVQRGFKAPTSYHLDRLRESPDGYLFDVMTNGFGVMYSYATRVSVEDRWAIAAYVRVLQYSQGAPMADLPAEMQELVLNPPAPAPAGGETAETH